MPEDIIKGRIVFEGGGMAGAVADGGSTANMTGSIMSKRGMMSAVTLPITDVLSGILKGIKTMGQWSPMLGAELIRMRKGLQLFLMPIGDTLANWLRPMAQGWIETASVFYEAYKDGGFWAGMKAAMGEVWDNLGWVDEAGNINFSGILENADDFLTIAAGLVVGSALIGAGWTSIMALIGGQLGLAFGATAASGVAASATGGIALWIPAALFLVSKVVGDLLGLGAGSGVIAAIATVVGIGTTTAAGVAIAWSIPIALTLVGVAAFLKAMADALAEAEGANQEWQGPDISGHFETSQEAIANFAMTDISKGQGTIPYQLNELTGQMEIVENSAKTMGENIVAEWSTMSLNMTTDLQGVGTEIVEEENKVVSLISALVGLPNITRYITYVIRYVTEG